MDEKENPWKTLRTELKYDNPWIRVEESQVITPRGNEGIYGKVSVKNQAVGIIPIDQYGNTWLVGQYRYTLDEYSWEIPEGGSPPGEKILETAKRELREETGLSATKWDLILRMHLSNSITDEEAFIFLAEDLTEGPTDFDDTEELKIRKVPFSQALQMVLDNQINDAMSVAGILKVAHCNNNDNGYRKSSQNSQGEKQE